MANPTRTVNKENTNELFQGRPGASKQEISIEAQYNQQEYDGTW